ncbi:hypothetical protein FACS189444_1330 [Spirochaetia bacterium]|nr:hypothetical protein FACS189444_1330 [Spirochaetia bacterium]
MGIKTTPFSWVGGKTNINPKTVLKKGWVINTCPEALDCVGVQFTASEDFDFLPGQPARNILFSERVSLPKNIYMWFLQRSSWTRLGLYMQDSLYDPDYGNGEQGHATTGATFVNLGSDPIHINKGERIVQALFFKGDVAHKYEGHYSNVENIKSQYAKKP